MKCKKICLYAVTLMAVAAANGQSKWEIVSYDWRQDADYRGFFTGIYFDWDINASGTQLTGNEVATSYFEVSPEPFAADISEGNGVFGIRFAEEGEEPYYIMEPVFFSRSRNHYFGNARSIGEEWTDRQSMMADFGFRVDPSAEANPEGYWEGLQIELTAANDGRLVDWGYEFYTVNIFRTGAGVGTLNIYLAESTTDPENVGANMGGTYAVNENQFTVVTDGDEDGGTLTVSAVGDLAWTREMEDEGHSAVMLNNTFMRPVGAGDLNVADVAGVWALSNLELEAGDLNGQYPWRSMLADTGLIELREDGAGVYYMLDSTLAREYRDGEDSAQNFTWSIQGPEIVIEVGDGDTASFTVSGSKEFARAYEFEDEGDYQSLQIEQLIRIDGPIHPAVKSLPLFKPATGAWGRFMDRGWMYVEKWPWVYSGLMGWQKVLEGNGRYVWLYDLKMGWVRTDFDMFPYFFGVGEGELYYVNEAASLSDEPVIYSFHEERWL